MASISPGRISAGCRYDTRIHSRPSIPEQPPQQRLQPVLRAEVLAVGGGVLGDEEELLRAVLDEPAGLCLQLLHGARQVAAAEGGDGAERAAPVAAGGDLQGGGRPPAEAAAQRRGPLAGARPSGSGAWPGTATPPAAAGLADGVSGSSLRRSRGTCEMWCSPSRMRAEPVGDVGVVVEPEDGVGLRQLVGELDAVALGHAPDGDDGPHRAVTLEIRGREQGVDGVLLGLLDEAARVDHHGLRGARVVDEEEPTHLEARGQLLGVDVVAGAAEGGDVDGARGCSHRAIIRIRWRGWPAPRRGRRA